MAANPSHHEPAHAPHGLAPHAEGDWRNRPDEGDAFYDDEGANVVRSLPWMSIALVGHALALLIAVFIVTAVIERPEIPPSAVAKRIADQIPDVQPESPDEPIVEELDKVVEMATEVDQINENVEDQNISEVVSPIKNPNPNTDPTDSPSPLTGPQASNGLGGGHGGGAGGPAGGGGPLGGTRGIRNKPKADRTNAALQWLADHQNRRGYWSPDGYHKDSIRITEFSAKVTRNVDTDELVKREHDVGLEQYRVGLTGLALLAFVGDGHTHDTGAFKNSVKRAATFLLGVQDAEGCFGERLRDDFVYDHAISTMAIAEIYALTGEQIFKAPAQRAVDFIVKCQNPGLGWRYGVAPGENDSSVTAWMVLALKSAKLADLNFDAESVYAGANAWFDKVEGKSDDGYLQTGYHQPASGNARPGYREEWDQNAAMDACNAMVRLSTSKYVAGSRGISALADRMMQDLPQWRSKSSDGKESSLKVDYYYWYYGSLAAFQVGGATWDKWEKEVMNPVLLKHQRGWHPKDRAEFPKEITNGANSKGVQGRHLLDEHGSWDGLDPWSIHGGRVYATAINALTLEVYYRYARVGDGK